VLLPFGAINDDDKAELPLIKELLVS